MLPISHYPGILYLSDETGLATTAGRHRAMAATSDLEMTVDEARADCAEMEADAGAGWTPTRYAPITGEPLDEALLAAGRQCGRCGGVDIGFAMRYRGGHGYAQYLACRSCRASALAPAMTGRAMIGGAA